MVEERERACDERVLEDGHDGADYAAGILAVCRHCRAGVAVSAAATVGRSHAARSLHSRQCAACDSRGTQSNGPVRRDAGRHGRAAIRGRRSGRRAPAGTARSSIHARWVRRISRLRPPQAARRHRIVSSPRRTKSSIRNSSLRDLVAIAYGVEPWRVLGGPDWLDSPRYDLRAVPQVPVSDPDHLDPKALQVPVTKLLASRFGLAIHVNRRCQAPCGKVAVTAPDASR